MIKIAGLGIAGSYIYSRLKNAGFDVMASEIKRDDYYIPCAYATNQIKINALLKNIGIKIDDYILSHADNIRIEGNGFSGVDFNSSGLITFDKNLYERDLLKNIDYTTQTINMGTNDTIIDATGISRYYLGQIPDDRKFYTVEYLTDFSDKKDFYFYFLKNGNGYFWSFPLKKNYHVGVGSTDISDMKMVKDYRRLKITGRMIRMRPLFDNMFNNNVIGVGESIGAVSPLTGEGIVPAIESSEILYQAIKKYSSINDIKEHYQNDMKKRFGYYDKLYGLVKNINNGKTFNFGNIMAIRSAIKSMNDFGIDMKIRKILMHFI